MDPLNTQISVTLHWNDSRILEMTSCMTEAATRGVLFKGV